MRRCDVAAGASSTSVLPTPDEDCALTRLPVGVLHHLALLLPADARLALRSTCQHLYTALAPNTTLWQDVDLSPTSGAVRRTPAVLAAALAAAGEGLVRLDVSHCHVGRDALLEALHNRPRLSSVAVTWPVGNEHARQYYVTCAWVRTLCTQVAPTLATCDVALVARSGAEAAQLWSQCGNCRVHVHALCVDPHANDDDAAYEDGEPLISTLHFVRRHTCDLHLCGIPFGNFAIPFTSSVRVLRLHKCKVEDLWSGLLGLDGVVASTNAPLCTSSSLYELEVLHIHNDREAFFSYAPELCTNDELRQVMWRPRDLRLFMPRSSPLRSLSLCAIDMWRDFSAAMMFMRLFEGHGRLEELDISDNTLDTAACSVDGIHPLGILASLLMNCPPRLTRLTMLRSLVVHVDVDGGDALLRLRSLFDSIVACTHLESFVFDGMPTRLAQQLLDEAQHKAAHKPLRQLLVGPQTASGVHRRSGAYSQYSEMLELRLLAQGQGC